MGSGRFNIVEDGAIVTLYRPVDIDTLAGAKSIMIVPMRNWAHATIIYSIGINPLAAGVVTIESVDAYPTPVTSTQIMFRYYRYESSQLLAAGAVHGALAWTTTAAAGLIPVAAGVPVMYVIELDAEELAAGHVGFRMCIADPAAASVGSAIAILSGPRYADKGTTNLSLVV